MGTTRFADAVALKKVMLLLYEAKIVLVAAANNDGLITFPATFDSCIGVSCHNNLKKGQIVYIDNSFDGVNIATYPVCLPEFKAIGTNSLSTAYIAGMICKEMNNKSSYYDIYQLFIKKSQKIDVSWKKYYLKRKIENVPKHEAIIILSNMELSESSDLFLNNLKEHIINDGYTCAILLKNGLNNPSDYNFTLESSPMSSIETLDFISKLCRPSIILINSQELINYADVIIRNDEIEVYISDSQTLRFKHSTFNYLWKIIKKIFESKK